MQYFGWHYQCTLIAEYERIPLAQVYDLTTINFLNDLSYLKAKADYDKSIAELNKRR